jgi:hypothetical protein
MVLVRVKRWVLAVLAMLTRPNRRCPLPYYPAGALRVAVRGSGPAA